MATSRSMRYQQLSADDSMHHSEDRRTTDQITGSTQKWIQLWRVLCGVMVVFFLLCAYVQINDPDPYIWIPVYTIPAMLCAVIAWKPECVEYSVWRLVCTVHLGCCILGAAYVLALVVEKMDNKIHNPLLHEEGRELGGVTIIIFWLCICRFSSFGNMDSYKSRRNGLLILLGIASLLPLVAWSMCFIDTLESSLSHCNGMFPGMLGGKSAKA